MKFPVVAAQGEEFLVRAALDDAAFVQDDDLVGVLDGAEAVGDGDGGAAGHELLEGLLDAALGLGVERGGGLVEDEDGRVLEDGAGDADALALAAGELDAPVADIGVVALFLLEDEVVGAGDARGGPRFRG